MPVPDQGHVKGIIVPHMLQLLGQLVHPWYFCGCLEASGSA